MVELWMIWTGLGFMTYCLIAGVCYVWFGKGLGWHVPEMPAAIWPLVLICMGPAMAGKALTEWLYAAPERKAAQKELDEARRKKDEQDAADAMKEGYR